MFFSATRDPLGSSASRSVPMPRSVQDPSDRRHPTRTRSSEPKRSRSHGRSRSPLTRRNNGRSRRSPSPDKYRSRRSPSPYKYSSRRSPRGSDHRPYKRRRDSPASSPRSSSSDSVATKVAGQLQKVFVSEFSTLSSGVTAQFAKLSQDVSDKFEAQNTTIAEQTSKLTSIQQQVTGQDLRIDALEKRSPEDLDPTAMTFELDKLWALEKSLIQANENKVLLTNFYNKEGVPTPEISRQPMLNKVMAKIDKKSQGKVQHVLVDKKLTQFSKVVFENKQGADEFRTLWRKEAVTNGSGQPIFAKQDLPPEVRKLRSNMVKIERKVKAYVQSIKLQHKVHINWMKHALFVDTNIVARRDHHGNAVWDDKDLEDKLAAYER